jgi:hypothetical protein
MGGQRHALAALPPGKTRYPLYRRLGGPQSRSRRMRKISPPTGIRSPDRPARSESLNRLSYPGSVWKDEDMWNTTQSWPCKRTGYGRCCPSLWSICRWALLIFVARVIMIANRILHSLKGKVGSDGRNWILGIIIVFLEPLTSAAVLCPCMCCHNRRPR